MKIQTQTTETEDLDTLATGALAQARICRSVIRDEIIPILDPHDRMLAERIARLIDRHEILSEEAVGHLESLCLQISREIERGTVRFEAWATAPEHLTEGVWIETRRSERASGLTRSLSELQSLLSACHALFDRLHAAEIMNRILAES